MSTAIAKNFQVGSDSTATNNFTIRQPATPDGTVRIANGNSGTTTDLVTVTSAGNVGVGVTPSAWNSAVRAIELLSPGSAIYGLSGGTTVTAGAYIDSVGWKYSVSGVPITRYDQGAFASGQHTWFNAASGTAGNAISWTQAMTLTAGGDLGVGTTSPSEKLHVVSTTTTQGIRVSGSVDNVAINLSNSGTSGKTWGIFSANSGSGAGGGSLGFWDGTAYRAIIDTNGNLLVGTTTVAQTLSTNNVLTLKSSGTAAIWGVGPTSSFGTFYVTNSGVGVSLAQGATSWGTVSDERQKDIIEPITDAANKMLSLRAVIGKYKTDTDGKRRSFLIAQDVQAVLPEAVDVGEDEAQTLSVRYTDTIPLLVAAIQELKAEFDSVKTELALLKGTA